MNLELSSTSCRVSPGPLLRWKALDVQHPRSVVDGWKDEGMKKESGGVIFQIPEIIPSSASNEGHPIIM